MRVVLAIITNHAGEVLLTRRAWSSSQGGRWEFPGGKIELGEEPGVALVREVKEELNLDVLHATWIHTASCPRQPCQHATNPASNEMSFQLFHVDVFCGDPICSEQQLDLRWVPWRELPCLMFPAANAVFLPWLMVFFNQDKEPC